MMKKQSRNSLSFRLVVMGSSGVGKSAFISMFLRGAVSPCYTPTVEHCHVWETSRGNSKCRLDIIDTSGSNDFPAMHKLYISTGQIFVLVHSVDDPKSFEKVLELLEEINKIRAGEEIRIFVVGNKSDRRRPSGMSSAEAELLLIDYMDVVRYSECNSHNMYSVASVFAQISDDVLSPLRRTNSFPTKLQLGTQEDDKGGKKWFQKKWKSLRRR